LKKKQNLKIISKITHATGKYLQRLMGPGISKESFKSIKTMHYLTACLWRVRKPLFCFFSLKGECVTCICLQCGRHKQNGYRFLDKTASLSVISTVYLFGQSLLNILS